MVTYTKLRNGGWGLRGPAEDLRAGASVTVQKRDGSTKTETVSKILWTGDGKALASIARGARAYSSRSRGSDYCGYPCPVSGRTCGPSNGPCHDCQ